MCIRDSSNTKVVEHLFDAMEARAAGKPDEAAAAFKAAGELLPPNDKLHQRLQGLVENLGPAGK